MCAAAYGHKEAIHKGVVTGRYYFSFHFSDGCYERRHISGRDFDSHRSLITWIQSWEGLQWYPGRAVFKVSLACHIRRGFARVIFRGANYCAGDAWEGIPDHYLTGVVTARNRLAVSGRLSANHLEQSRI